MKHEFFGIELKKDPTLGYFKARFANGADVVLYQTGAGPWRATLFIGASGSGVEVFASRGKTPAASLRALERKTEALVKDAIQLIAKHFTKLGRSLRPARAQKARAR